MKWISNTTNPKSIIFQNRVMPRIGETMIQAAAREKAWLQGKIIGLPKANSHFTVEQLQAMDLVGVYMED